MGKTRRSKIILSSDYDKRQLEKAYYIIFHPDHQRQLTRVKATVMVGQRVLTSWAGDIYVDMINAGNEDPFVFNNPWLYSYCHASQLRRNRRDDSYLQTGSKIIFVSGQQANNGILCIDTVFLIGGIQKWDNKRLQLPLKYQSHFQNNQSSLWKRHFKFPFHGKHKTVSHTYEADLWSKNKTDFSFLPLDKNADRVSVSFDNFKPSLIEKITNKVKGKYPVLLTDSEIKIVIAAIENATTTKILRNITSNVTVTSKKGNC